jgi:hypothetical protein
VAQVRQEYPRDRSDSADQRRTVKYHIDNIIGKLDAENRLHALAIAIEKDLLI